MNPLCLDHPTILAVPLPCLAPGAQFPVFFFPTSNVADWALPMVRRLVSVTGREKLLLLLQYDQFNRRYYSAALGFNVWNNRALSCNQSSCEIRTKTVSKVSRRRMWKERVFITIILLSIFFLLLNNNLILTVSRQQWKVRALETSRVTRLLFNPRTALFSTSQTWSWDCISTAPATNQKSDF